MKISDEVIKEHYLYQQLKEQFDELRSYAVDVAANCDDMAEELKYLVDFIKHKNLEDEFQYFRDHAHLDDSDELPFPPYVLK